MLLLELAQRDVKGCWHAASLSTPTPTSLCHNGLGGQSASVCDIL